MLKRILFAVTAVLLAGPAFAQSSLTIGTPGTSAGSVVLGGSTSGTATIQVPAAAGTTTFQLPSGNGTNTYLLQTDGSGHTSWVAPPSGGSGLTEVGISSNTTASCGNYYIASASLTLTLPLTTSQTTACQIGIKNATANTGTTAVTLAVNGSDSLGSGTAGVGTTFYAGQGMLVGTDAANHWWRQTELGACVVYTSSATVQITATKALYIAFGGAGGSGGTGYEQLVASTIGSGGGGGGPGQFLTHWFVGPDLATLGSSQTLTLASAPASGSNGGASTFGPLTANGGGFGGVGTCERRCIRGRKCGYRCNWWKRLRQHCRKCRWRWQQQRRQRLLGPWSGRRALQWDWGGGRRRECVYRAVRGRQRQQRWRHHIIGRQYERRCRAR